MDDELKNGIEEWLEVQEKRRDELLKKFPPNPPNNLCHYALIKGLLIENSFDPSIGELNFLFKTDCESVYIWTHKKDDFSVLVVDVNESVKELDLWKNLFSIIRLVLSYSVAFEEIIGCDSFFEYKWIYHFNQYKTKIKDAVFYNVSDIEQNLLASGKVIKATEFADLAPEIELLMRDDRAYTSLSMLYSSFEIHNICLTCELSSTPWHDHLSSEPEIWEHAEFIPSMELAIVQACRSVESLLGEPPNRNNKNGVLRHKEKWETFIGINPDNIFEKAGKSYLEFYYDLFFELRNPSAHSYGNIHYDLERSRATQAQCFAAIIVDRYIQKHVLKNYEARSVLQFNESILSRVNKTVYSKTIGSNE